MLAWVEFRSDTHILSRLHTQRSVTQSSTVQLWHRSESSQEPGLEQMLAQVMHVELSVLY